ncbi:hypothetical protein [Borreliella garinii]
MFMKLEAITYLIDGYSDQIFYYLIQLFSIVSFFL